ncbi:MAG: TetR family transcriptional regulator [Acidimicrobiales bacterium]|nr:MAG: TetR family transcriptional regulator [Acidimicrobiales bacterium]
MPRVTIDFDLIIETALQVVDDAGPDALSLSSVARELGVGPSALYTHVDGLSGLQEAAAIASTRMLAAELRDAAIGRAGDDAVRSVATAYRSYATTYPGRVSSALRVDEAPALDDAVDELDGVFALLGIARGLARDPAAQAARNVRRAIHGFVVSERADTVAAQTDGDYESFVLMLCRMLEP